MARQIAVELFLMVLAGIVLALIGPFGSYELPLTQRLVLWPLMLLSGYPVFRGLGVVSRWLAQVTHIPLAVAVPLALAVGALPVTLLVTLLWFRVPAGALLRTPGLGPLYLQVLIVGLIVHVAMHLLFRPTASHEERFPAPAPHADPPTAATGPDPALPLPPGFGAIHALKGEDHYVRVIGDGREELVLMRMRDAIERLGSADGLRVHRSWWVARAGISAVRREGRAATITLVNGQEAPVARDMMAALRAAGWL
ncbi:MAG: LytTR family transcriptional regulator DNA-binding domain-containing protein [Sphingopyxis sp.]|nr:LytTR family transcriptional regulator DNA-binding domain-containing protein [Sphingopyxis sp.]